MNISNKIKEIVRYILVVGGITGVFLLFFRLAMVDGSSMYPTLNDRDILLLRRTQNITYGDIVAISSRSLEEELCKRVIGLEGDHVVINKDGLFVNDKKIIENYVNENVWSDMYDINLVVPKDKVFVMGDNRNHSLDSRGLGCLKVVDIKGILILNFTELTHINSQEYKIILILLWCIFIVSYIVEIIVRYIKKHSKSNKKTKYEDGRKDYGKESSM